MKRIAQTPALPLWKHEALEVILQDAKDSARALTVIVGVLSVFIGPLVFFAGNKETTLVMLLLTILPLFLEWKRYFDTKEKILAGTYGGTEAEREEILAAHQRLKQQTPP